MKETQQRMRRKSTNPFDSSDDDNTLEEDEFHDCHESDSLLPKSTQKRSARIDFNIGSHATETAAPALVFEDRTENQHSDFVSPLEAALQKDVLTPSSADNHVDDYSDDENDDTDEETGVKETQWARLVRMTSPLTEKMNQIKGSSVDTDDYVRKNFDRPTLNRAGSNASFQSAKSENSSETGFTSVGEQVTPLPPSRHYAKTKTPGRTRSSIKRRRPPVASTSAADPVLDRLESFPKDSEFTMDYRSIGTPWTHLILLEDLGTASSWAVLLIPYVAFIICLILDSDTTLLVYRVGPLSAATSCVTSNAHTGYSVPLIPPPQQPCSFPFQLSEGKGVIAYGGKGYATAQAHYHAIMPNGTAFSSEPLKDVPAMSTFLRGDVSFTNLSTEAVALVAQGKVAFSTVVSQRKKDSEWVPVSISKPSRLSMACSLIGRSAIEPHPSFWNCSTPRIIDVLFSMPGTAILTGADLEVNVLYSYYKGVSAESDLIDHYTSSIDNTEKKEVSYVFSDSVGANGVFLNASISHPNGLISDLVKSSSYTIEHERSSYETIDIAVRLFTLTVSLCFLVFWCWSLGWKGFCGVWGEANGCFCEFLTNWTRPRSDSEDLPLVRRKKGGLLWWESPWLLFPERRYLLFLLVCLLLIQNPLLAYTYFDAQLYSRKNIHAAADAMVGIGVHGVLMLWLCLFCGLRYHTATITRQRAKQQRQLLQLRRTAKYIGEADHSIYGSEDAISRYTASYYDQFGDIDGSGSVSHLRMKHDPCGDSWADFLLPKVFIFFLGATSVLITAVCRFPADGDDAATLSPEVLRQYNAIYVFSSTVQLSILVTWVFLIIRNTILTGAKLRKQPFLSTRPAQLAFRVMSSTLFLGIGALAVPVIMDVFKLIKQWYLGKAGNHHPLDPALEVHGTATSSALDVLLRVLFHVSQRFPYSGTAASIGPGKVLYVTTCALVTAFIFLPSRTFYEDERDTNKKDQRKKLMAGNNVFHKTLTEKMQQRRDKRSVVTLARYTHTWRVFPLPIKKVPTASDFLSGGSFYINGDFRIRYGESNGSGVVYVGRYMPVFCLEIACWLLEASWQSYYDPKEFSTNDWAPGRMSLESIGLQLETAIYDESTETQAIVATNIIPQVDGEEDSIIVVAFRGTSSRTNVKNNLKFQQVPLPERMMDVDERATFQVHPDHVQACDHYGWDEWLGSSTEKVASLRSFSPTHLASLDSLNIQWLPKKPSAFSTVSSGAKAVIRATPLARQALACVHAGFLEAYSRIRKQLWESVLRVLQRQFAKAVRRCKKHARGMGESSDKGPRLRLPKVYISGHSLGGSLGQLLALDLACNCELVLQTAQATTGEEELFSLPGVHSSPLFAAKKSKRHSSLRTNNSESIEESPSPLHGRKSFFPHDDDSDDNSRDQGGAGATDRSKINRVAKLRLQPPIAVYTFGQPRVGNRAFARLYKKKVPHTFRVVNEGDAFTTMPQFTICGGLYKHAGLEVMLDEGQTGNTLVGPTVVETLFRFTKVRTSVAAHSLERYRDCLESSLGQDELQEYYRGHSNKGGIGASRSYDEGGSSGVSATLPDWVTQIKRTSSD